MSLRTLRRQAQASRVCWVCREPNTEQGQRGPKSAHRHCRVLVDAGYRVSQVRALRVEHPEAA